MSMQEVVKRAQKRKQQRDDNSSDEEDEDASFLDKLSLEDTIPVDFEFFQFKEEDYHSINRFVSGYLGETQFHSGELTNELIEQFYVGSVIKVEEEEETVGILTAFNIIKHSKLESIQAIKNYFLEQTKEVASEQEHQFLANLLSGAAKKSIGLIISERIESVPIQLTPHLFSQLTAEIASALQTERDDKLKEFEYAFDYYMLKVPVYYQSAEKQYRSKKRSKTSEGQQTTDEPSIYYLHPEEEIISQFAEKKWVSKTKFIQSDTPNAMDGRNIIKEEFHLLLLPRSSLPAICSALEKEIKYVVPTLPK